MSIKNELILSYIKELDVGTKISVRRLSEILNVSVGTVYKAIKAAEAQGLVVTKPKSGTFKIDSGVIGEAEPVSLKRAAKFLGLDYDNRACRCRANAQARCNMRRQREAAAPSTV